MESGLLVRPSSAEDDARRDAFVAVHPHGTFFHQSGWISVVQRVFWHQPRDLLAWRGDELVGVLPLMSVPSLMGFAPGNLVSVPYGVYGGPLGESPEVEEALVRVAAELAEKERVGHLELRYHRDPGSGLASSDLYWTFLRELPEKVDEVLARMPKKARAEARKARERHGLSLSCGVWYVDDLYRMFVANKHSLGSPALPDKMFRELLRQFQGRIHVHLVRRGAEPLAAVMSFRFGDTLVAYYSGTVEGADRAYSASNFMYMALQEWAVEQGFRRFDFGRSRKDAGAFHFKLHQGFEPSPLHYRYHLVRSRTPPSFNPSNPRTELLRETWKKLPRWMVRRLSSRLARYLP